MNTVQSELAELEAARAAQQTRLGWRARILGELPPQLIAPTISNESVKAHDGKPGAWLSFRASYGDTWKPTDLLAELETVLTPLPATLARYGNYRRAPHVGYADDLPQEFSRAELTDCEPIAPLWLVPNQHTKCEATAFYRGPSGLIYRVLIDADLPVSVHARRREFKGGWQFEPGTAKLRYPDGWHSVTGETGEGIAQVSVHSRAYIDTSMGLSAAVYFSPFCDHREWMLPPSQFWRRLVACSNVASKVA